MRNHIWPYTAHQDFAEKDCRRIRRRMGFYCSIWVCLCKLAVAIQVFHLPCQCKLQILNGSASTNIVQDLGATWFSGLECRLNPVFIPQRYELPVTIPGLPSTFMMQPLQVHVLFLSTFASLIAPFGGFFASGIKRTFKIKDFGDSIPGHGGMTDRMDCQFIMGTLTFMYYQGFIATHKANVGSIIELAVIGLTAEEQLDVIRRLSTHLVNQGVLANSVGILIISVGC